MLSSAKRNSLLTSGSALLIDLSEYATKLKNHPLTHLSRIIIRTLRWFDLKKLSLNVTFVFSVQSILVCRLDRKYSFDFTLKMRKVPVIRDEKSFCKFYIYYLTQDCWSFHMYENRIFIPMPRFVSLKPRTNNTRAYYFK